jgi:hypothetical protein
LKTKAITHLFDDSKEGSPALAPMYGMPAATRWRMGSMT